MDVTNTYILVLGGSSGIGRSCMEEFGKRGYSLIVVHRDLRSRLSELEREWSALRSQGIALHAFNQDGVKSESIVALIQKIKAAVPDGSIHALLHCISWGSLKPMRETLGKRMSREDLKLTAEAMSWSLYDWTTSLIDAGLFTHNARVLGFSSEGVNRVWPHYAAVANAKSSLENLIRHMAFEFAPFGLRVNGIRAGITETPSLRLIPGYEKLINQALQRNPSGRLTRPEDVARVAFLLSTEEAHWINGAVIPVDGGEGLQ